MDHTTKFSAHYIQIRSPLTNLPSLAFTTQLRPEQGFPNFRGHASRNPKNVLGSRTVLHVIVLVNGVPQHLVF